MQLKIELFTLGFFGLETLVMLTIVIYNFFRLLLTRSRKLYLALVGLQFIVEYLILQNFLILLRPYYVEQLGIQGFGYRPVELKEEELETIVIYQVGAIIEFAKAYGLSIEHVRPHGAMYKLAGESYDFSAAIAKAIKKCSEWLIYYAPAGDITERVSEDTGIQVAREISLEKTYNPDLTIDYSVEDNTNNYEMIKRLQHLLHTSQIRNSQGGMSFAEVDTIHFSNKYKNSTDLIKQAKANIIPSPVNYNNAKISGWVD